jgi:O-antigen ligase
VSETLQLKTRVFSTAIMRTLLAWTVFLSFSYVHLPLVAIHHSLGSLFNFPLFVLILVAGTNIVLGDSFPRALLRYFVCYAFCTILVLIGSFMLFNGLLGSSDPAQTKLCVSAISNLWLPLLVVCIGYATHTCRYSIEDLYAHSHIPTRILVSFLCFEFAAVGLKLPLISDLYQAMLPVLQYRTDSDAFAGRVRGLSNEPSYLAIVVIFLTTIHLLTYLRGNKKALVYVLLLGAIGVVSLSKNLLLSLVVLISVTSVLNKGAAKYGIPFLGLLGLIFFYFLQSNEGIYWQYRENGIDFSTLTRIGSWHAAFSGFLDSPVFGWGPGSAGYLLDRFYPSYFFMSNDADHWIEQKEVFGIPVFNYFFRSLFEYGLVGLLFLIYLCALSTRACGSRFFSRENVLILVAFFLVINMTDNLTYWPFIILLFAGRDRGAATIDDPACQGAQGVPI